MKPYIKINDVDFSNQDFWSFYFHVNFPNGYDEESDMSVGDMVEDISPMNIDWVNKFTQYYDGVLEESDGYLDNPTTLKVAISDSEDLKIEFHPGDTIFFINNQEIGCTGPHHIMQQYSYEKLEKCLSLPNGNILFLLLLPMAVVTEDYIDIAEQKVDSLLQIIFPNHSCNELTKCIIQSLIED